MINYVTGNDLKNAIELVNKVFVEFVSVDYSELGQKTFHDYLKHKYEDFSKDIDSGRKKMWCYYEDEQLVGVIATRDVSHIALLFVEKEFQRRGIAKQLFATALHDIQKQEDIREITVNSSPYAVNIYQKLGFVKTDSEKENDGIRYTPMKYVL